LAKAYANVNKTGVHSPHVCFFLRSVFSMMNVIGLKCCASKARTERRNWSELNCTV